MKIWTTIGKSEPIREDVQFLYLVRSTCKAPLVGGIPEDDAALFTTEDEALEYARTNIASTPNPDVDDEIRFTLHYVALDVHAPPYEDGVDVDSLPFGWNGEPYVYPPWKLEKPVRMPVEPRFAVGDLVLIEHPQSVVDTGVFDDDVLAIVGIVVETIQTKREWLDEHGNGLDPATIPPDPEDLYLTQALLERLTQKEGDEDQHWFENVYTVYFFYPDGALGHCHPDEKELKPYGASVPADEIFLYALQMVLRGEKKFTSEEESVIWGDEGRLRNLATFDFETRTFRPAHVEPDGERV